MGYHVERVGKNDNISNNAPAPGKCRAENLDRSTALHQFGSKLRGDFLE